MKRCDFIWRSSSRREPPSRSPKSHSVSLGHGVAPLEITVGGGTYEARAVDPAGVAGSRLVDPVALALHMMGRTEVTGDPVADEIASWLLPV